MVATLTLVSLLEDELKGLIDLNQTRTAAGAVKNRLRPMLKLPERQAEPEKEETAPIEELCLEGLSYSYEGKPLLQDMYLKIEQGKRYALIGESGCGKTTTAKIIAGILRDYEGQILQNGIGVAGRPGLLSRSGFFSVSGYHRKQSVFLTDRNTTKTLNGAVF